MQSRTHSCGPWHRPQNLENCKNLDLGYSPAGCFALQAMHGAEGPEVQEQVVLEGMRINKQVARDQINKSLPAPDAVIQMHQKVLIGLALASRDKRLRVSPEP